MLTGLTVRDVVLIEALDLAPGPGLTALTGETGAGKSIVLDALGLATGARAEVGLVRRGAPQASVAAVFSLPPGHAAYRLLAERGLDADPGEDLVLRRQLSADGRSRAFVNDQPASVGLLKELGACLLEVHGQHESVGLLDPRTHRALLDDYGGCGGALAACRAAWIGWRSAAERAEALRALGVRRIAEAEEAALRLAELDRLDPRPGEEDALAEARGLLGAAEKVVGDLKAARDAFAAAQSSSKLSQALRALERAQAKALQAGGGENTAVSAIAHAVAAGERTMLEAEETLLAIDAAAAAFVFEPQRLERTEERLFALRAAARRLGVTVEALPAERLRFAELLRDFETADHALEQADKVALQAQHGYRVAAEALRDKRLLAARRLASAVEAELAPLKLDKARFRVAVEPLDEARAGPEGADRVTFEIATNPGAPFGPLGDIASGGELARLALALKASLATRTGADTTDATLVFDEVDQGVGGAVADAVGLRLKRLAAGGQVLVVTHSPQVAARADTHWRVAKTARDGYAATSVSTLDTAAREEEIARMLAGAEVTDAARAAARALICD